MEDDKIAVLKTQLYTACEDACAGAPDRAFTQEDLTNLDVVPPKDLKTLLRLIQQLTAEHLFIPVNLHSGLAWRIRSEGDAAKYKTLTNDQSLVYEFIDNAGSEGAWQQDIKRKLNLQDNALRKALKELEAKRLVAQFTTVENISKKMWIKANVKPSSRATGGPWHTDQILDEGFIEALQGVVMSFIKNRGSYLSKSGGGSAERSGRSASPVLPKKGVINGAASDAALKSRKRTADAMSKGDDNNGAAPPAKARKTQVRLPLPAGYMDYPTAEEITEGIQAAEVAKGQPLKPEHVQELIDVLVWDNRVEEIKMGDRIGYRATRITKQNPSLYSKPGSDDFWEPRANGLTTAPCGKCPVFDLCEEGGPVWAGGCEYFDQWLI